MNKLLVILGPNASGKSDLAIQIAKLFQGEIISADSRQVYKGMDIGTGKVPRDKNSSFPSKEYISGGIRHYLLDEVNPREYFSVVQYKKLALSAIKNIQKRGKLPILCGGTGLYLSAIIEGWQFPNIPPNEKFREELAQMSSADLFAKLQALAPQRAKTIDKNNKRRLIRALEIIHSSTSIPSLKKIPPSYDIFIIGIKREKTDLHERIRTRLEKRIKKGMIEEIQRLKDKGISSKRLDDFGLEYRWVNRYLEKKITLSEMKEGLLRDIKHYAKRQMTWFKKIKNIHWVHAPEEAISLVRQWLNKNGHTT